MPQSQTCGTMGWGKIFRNTISKAKLKKSQFHNLLIFYFYNMKKFTAFIICLIIYSCDSKKELPFLGEPISQNGHLIYPTISSFSFMNQDSLLIRNQHFDGKIYLADFIFLSCPTICPKMTNTMKKVHDHFINNDQIYYISYSIDPEHDSIPRLKEYAMQLNASNKTWQFVTGNKDSILYLAEHAYYSKAYIDSTSPGGFTHSGGILLVDKNRHLRGVYNGTAINSSDKIIADIKLLLEEE